MLNVTNAFSKHPTPLSHLSTLYGYALSGPHPYANFSIKQREEKIKVLYGNVPTCLSCLQLGKMVLVC